MNTRLFSFIGGVTGAWRVVNMSTIVGAPLPDVTRLDLVTGTVPEMPDGAKWVLRGLTSSERYVTRSEKTNSSHDNRHSVALMQLVPLSSPFARPRRGGISPKTNAEGFSRRVPSM